MTTIPGRNLSGELAGDEVLRAFIALDLDAQVRVRLADLQAELRQISCRVSWAPPRNIHLTLVFLGDLFGAQVPELVAALDEIASCAAPFSMGVAGVDAFGPPAAPRIVWAGIEEATGALRALQDRTAMVVRSLGFQLEDRPFHPHLTLGRVRDRRGAAELTSRLSSLKNVPYGQVEVKELLLMRSRLVPQGAEYSLLHASALKGAH